MSSISEIDVEALDEQRSAGAVVLDVRETDEYVAGHVPGAVLIPLSELDDRRAEVPEASTVYVICRSGARSLRACEALSGGSQEFVNVAGGTLAWIESGRPVVTGLDRG